MRVKSVLGMLLWLRDARVAELADAPDLGSGGSKGPWGFNSPLSHQMLLVS